MAAQASAAARERDTSIRTYRTRRDFARTPEPSPQRGQQASFVVQKHAARRLHWDLRLEHGGVLWSWAVPKGPSLDPADKRMAVHVEDHPLDYASFSGTIPKGQYGAGTVEIWDRGTWSPEGDAEAGMRRGELKFTLAGDRLAGRFALIRMRRKAREPADTWLLLKERDGLERAGADAAWLERERGSPAPRDRPDATPVPGPPASGAVRAAMPERLKPQLAEPAEEPVAEAGWVNELKFDGYRLLAWKQGGLVRLVTRNGHDWTSRLPRVARAVGRIAAGDALLDGELVALNERGVSSFSRLQAALADGNERELFFYLFDLVHLDGWDLRPCRLVDRKAALEGLASWRGLLRYSEHVAGRAAQVRRQACALGLEGILCKRADAPYREGRSRTWLKLKCQGREEFVVLGWTPPEGRRTGLGALHVGYYDAEARLHYAGGVGTGYTAAELGRLRRQLEPLRAAAPPRLLLAGDRPDATIVWVAPALVVEVQYAGWTESGRLRHAVYLGLRADKPAQDVVRAAPTEAAQPREATTPPVRSGAVVTARAPGRTGGPMIAGVHLTHPDRELWPGITKHDLAEYWRDVAAWALPGIAHRPLALVRCPDGIEGEHFFQKHGHASLPRQLREGQADGAPYIALDDIEGLVAAAQASAIELHAWGATEADPLRPDQLVFDLDPGEGVGMAALVRAALDLRERLGQVQLAAFCRTSGGKGLHVVVPLRPAADWAQARAFCRAFAERMAGEKPDRYVAVVKKAARQGRILVDWLRNGLGSTAVASYSPRARPGAGVATPLAWREVTPRLDPATLTLRSIPGRLKRLRRDPWDGFAELDQHLPGGQP